MRCRNPGLLPEPCLRPRRRARGHRVERSVPRRTRCPHPPMGRAKNRQGIELATVGDLYDEVAEDRCILRVHVQPGAGRDAIAGRHGSALKVRIRARPVDGAANSALLDYLAGQLGVRKSGLAVVSGHRSRSKRVSVAISSSELTDRLVSVLDLASPEG